MIIQGVSTESAGGLAGWRPREEPMLQVKSKDPLVQNSLLGGGKKEDQSLFSSSLHLMRPTHIIENNSLYSKFINFMLISSKTNLTETSGIMFDYYLGTIAQPADTKLSITPRFLPTTPNALSQSS